jgi:hypothetical protein
MTRRRKARNSLRDLLLSEPTDKRVLMKFDLLEELEAAMASGNMKKRNEIGRKLAAITKEIQTAEAEQRAAMIAAIDRARDTADDEARVAKLCQAFELCCLMQVVSNDDFGGGETVDRAIEHKHAIAAALDAIALGRRSALAALLESPFAGVRASAGAHLLNANLLRERVVPLLQEIEQNVSGSAGWTAFWALSPNDHGAWLTGEASATNP